MIPSIRPVNGYIIKGTNSLLFTQDPPPENVRPIAEKRLRKVNKTVHHINKVNFNQLNKFSVTDISNVKSESNKPFWVGGRVSLRPVNKTLNLWNPNDQSASQSMILTNANSLPNLLIRSNCQVVNNNAVDVSLQMGALQSENHNHSNSPTHKEYQPGQTKPVITFTTFTCSDESDRFFCQPKLMHSTTNESEMEKDNDDSDNYSTECEYFDSREKSNLNIWSKPFTVYMQRNADQQLGFAVSCLHLRLNETVNEYLVVSDIPIHDEDNGLQVGDCIFSINKVGVSSVGTLKSVELLKTEQSPSSFKFKGSMKALCFNLESGLTLDKPLALLSVLCSDNYSFHIICILWTCSVKQDVTDSEYDILSPETATEDEDEMIGKIISNIQNRVFTESVEVQVLQMSKSTNKHSAERSVTDGSVKNEDTKIQTQIRNRCARILRRKVLQWLHLNRSCNYLKSGMKPADKNEGQTIQEDSTRQTDSDDDSTLCEDDQYSDCDDEKVWGEDRVPIFR
ncbi:unnamed protein product [Heterobilharzia americana]|nr:unnamed protein product [Heterobilharzia americana]